MKEWYIPDVKTAVIPRYKKRTGVLGLALGLILILIFGVSYYIYIVKEVTIVDDGKTLVLKTKAATVEELLKETNRILGLKDTINVPLTAKLKEGEKIVINRAKPVKIAVDGREIKLLTVAKTIADAIKEAGITVGPQDIVEPSPSELVGINTEVKIIRVKVEEKTQEVALAFRTIKRPTNGLFKGRTKVLTKGKTGLARTYYKITYYDGKVVKKEVVKQEVVKKPVDEVILVGTKDTVSRGGKVIRFSRVIEVVATAYTHTGYRTATGVYPHRGVVAVDPDVIPYGTRLYIDGYGYGTALDTGSAIKGARVDLFFDSYGEAISWGRRFTRVYVLE
ncbi:ubiquitin-like domain-containing protein [Carboxydothermus pertinax]|uniref:G5 domain-containing protein n=1 Tax=Carboxydothermus pertinax TaxID=870242 RepID=A0A1L8CTB1_9THEO|nr:ubiquitin-like domain-containing protein [Carboxydothermus pertinax]GAV22142.1 hypothetical protein cpu_06520 [Carboxydothermus pertinax]